MSIKSTSNGLLSKLHLYHKASSLVILTTIVYSSAVIANCTAFEAFHEKDFKISAALREIGFESTSVVYSDKFDFKGSGNVNYEALETELGLHSDLDIAMIALDWEGKPYKVLKGIEGEKTSDEMLPVDKIEESYKEVFAKTRLQISNEVKIGYYGIPAKDLGNAETPLLRNSHLDNVASVVDVFLPTAYLRNHTVRGDNTKIVLKYIKQSLDYACSVNKELYVFIHHRWHKRSKSDPYHLIPLPDFTNFVQNVTSLGSDQCGVDGLIWWGADALWLEKEKQGILVDMKNVIEYEEYVQNIIESYAEAILDSCS